MNMNQAPSPENNQENPIRTNAENKKWFKAEFDMWRKYMSKAKTLQSESKIAGESTTVAPSSELLEEERRRKYELHKEAGKYHGPSEEELAHRNMLIKSRQLDREFIISKKLFLQELLNQGYQKSHTEIIKITNEIEKLEAEFLQKRKIIEKNITSVIDKIEATTPGLEETLREERRILETAPKVLKKKEPELID